MVDNTNQSKNGSSSESGIQKYIGVASVNVLAVNPKNDTLRKYGWQISDDAQEPVYMSEIDRNGKKVKTARVRFLVQLMDLQDKPVIPLDFWVHNEWEINKEGTITFLIINYCVSPFSVSNLNPVVLNCFFNSSA